MLVFAFHSDNVSLYFAFSLQLALYMTNSGQSKLKAPKRSKLFHKSQRLIDTFFDEEDEIAVAARAIAPVDMKNSFLSFIHKTVQEYFAGKATIDALKQAILETPLDSVAEIEAAIREVGMGLREANDDFPGPGEQC